MVKDFSVGLLHADLTRLLSVNIKVHCIVNVCVCVCKSIHVYVGLRAASGLSVTPGNSPPHIRLAIFSKINGTRW